MLCFCCFPSLIEVIGTWVLHNTYAIRKRISCSSFHIMITSDESSLLLGTPIQDLLTPKRFLRIIILYLKYRIFAQHFSRRWPYEDPKYWYTAKFLLYMLIFLQWTSASELFICIPKKVLLASSKTHMFYNK